MNRLVKLAEREWKELTTVRASDRPWQMPVAAALASGLPIVAGAAFDRIAEGVVASLAGLVFLYLPATAMAHRMATMMACGFGMVCSFALGAVCHLVPWATIPLITMCAIVATTACQFYRIPPPGSLFFIMTASLAAYMPGSLSDALTRTGLLAVGCIHATLVAFVYSLVMLRRRPPAAAPVPAAHASARMLVDPVTIGLLVGASLVAADLLGLARPYWVPVSCLVVLQGVNLRSSWNRQVHRILGTLIGLGVTWALLPTLTNGWLIATAIIILTFVIETAVVRHYGFATIFITPLTILLAEAPALQHGGGTSGLMTARLLDTVLGAAIGFVGAALLHSPWFRDRAEGALRTMARQAPRDRTESD